MALFLSQLYSLKHESLDASPTRERKSADSVFDEGTIRVMEEYFHVQDRDVLLKYLRDTMLSEANRYR